ncbi:hypothetical protein ACFZAM_19500 [Streptomyces sp. NPDC008079]|uniref:P-loop NTPase n=1 Tax=unclassified Streptomyces TaxID=2593676 RepID=UPI0036E1CD01
MDQLDWQLIDREFLAGRREASRESLVRYFDGALPTWETVLADVPRREAVSRITGNLLYERGSASTVHLVVGPSGEGKSTLIRQVAVDLASSHEDWRVYWRDSGDTLDLKWIAELDPDRNTLFVSDDAEKIATGCFDVLRRLEGRSDLHFLLAARDTDWRAVRADSLPWNTLNVTPKRIALRGLGKDGVDAREIVEAWTRSQALGQLASYNQVEDRVAALLAAVRGEEASLEDGALLGGMLRVRVGDRLDGHVQQMLGRLVHYPLSNGRTLAYAFFMIAALHGINVREMSPRLLAEALNIDVSRVEEEIVIPLGEEAAAARAGDRLLVRHRAVAESALRVARSLGVDMKDIYARLTRVGIRVATRPGSGLDAKEFRYMSQKLSSSPEYAIGSARAAVEEEPDDLRRVVNLVVVLRHNAMNDELTAVAQEHVGRIRTMVNSREAARRFFYEWSIAEGKSGRPEIACWLTAVSLADLAWADPLRDERDVEWRMAGFVPGFKALAARTVDERFARGVRAVETLLRGWPVSPRTERDMVMYRSYAKSQGVPEMDRDTCRTELTAAVVAAWRLRSRELPDVPAGSTLRFHRLFQKLDEHPA